MAKPNSELEKKHAAKIRGNMLRKFFSLLGPGLTTGAADDDPSGVATYASAGALLGTAQLWTALVTWPLMANVQFMCARIGMVTGHGLSAAFRQRFPHWLVVIAACALFVANTINVASDLAGMADAAQMLTGLNSIVYVLVFGTAITVATIRLRYFHIAAILKWLALVLFAYIITAFLVQADWPAILRDTFIPKLPGSHEAWSMLVAILGTTISPYLFYWQAAMEIEEEKAIGRRLLAWRKGATRRELQVRKMDVGVGTFFTNLVFYFIVLTTALTLHKHGITKIESTKEAAEALRPLAGDLAYLLFTIGIIGVGFIAIPTLAGSAAYALSGVFKWRQGIDEGFSGARAFYTVFILSTAAAIALDFIGVNPIRFLYWTAIINGLLAPFLLIGIWLIAADRKIMCGQPSSRMALTIVGLTILVMFGAAIGMFVF